MDNKSVVSTKDEIWGLLKETQKNLKEVSAIQKETKKSLQELSAS